MSEQNNIGNNKRIAKNTLFLYFRMILIMGVTLYTSRVILDKLGVDDYGLYQVVGGVVAMLSFLNGTLSIGTSRFLTYELGTGDTEKLRRTFSTSFYIHGILALIILLLMETGGLWFLYNKLVIPANRLTACVWVFQLSILTTMISVTQVPYTATIMAHERMNIYAYISIFEALAKLCVCYLLSITTMDRLIFYAILLAIVQILVAVFYRVYSIHHFEESRLQLVFDRTVTKGMMGFSGWNVMANLSDMLRKQGLLVLCNLFFAPAIIAAQAIANQVAVAMMQFINNFRTALNPQIIKLYAAGDRNGSKKLTLETTVVCFDMILLLGLPLIIVMDKIMHVWLVEVPEYAVIFTQWIIICHIVGTFSASFYIPMMAANKMRVNSITAFFTGIVEFCVLYLLFKIGFGPMWMQYFGLLNAIIYSMVVKPYVLCKDIDYKWQEIMLCFWSCAKVLILSLAISIPVSHFIGNDLLDTIIKIIVSVFAVALSSYLFMSKQMKYKLKHFISNKLKNVRYKTN